jgi:transposase InsO family protein
MNDTSCIFQIIQDALDQPENKLSVTNMCAIAGVSRSGYYAWLNAAPVRELQEQKDRADFDLILEAYKTRGYSKGAKGIYMCLMHRDPPVIMNLKKIRRLMKKYHLLCPIRKANPYRQLARALKTSTIADNLLNREFELYGPRTVLLTDITYIPYNGIFAYLSTILDAYTKQILSYVVSDSLEVDFVLETVEILIRDHGVSLTEQTIVHSDQGAHYTSYRFIQILHDKDLRQSMSRRGNCWDNAPQESFFGHMKDEIEGLIAHCDTFEAVLARVDDWMDYYNNDRGQWDLMKLAPKEYYQYLLTGIYPLPVFNSDSLTCPSTRR